MEPRRVVQKNSKVHFISHVIKCALPVYYTFSPLEVDIVQTQAEGKFTRTVDGKVPMQRERTYVEMVQDVPLKIFSVTNNDKVKGTQCYGSFDNTHANDNLPI